MSRRRYLSTKISLDKALNQIAKANDFAALFYTWGVPHAEEDATLHGDPEELLVQVMPWRREKNTEDIERVLTTLADAKLILWDRQNRIMQYPINSFYQYQTNIAQERRRNANIVNNYGDKGFKDDAQETARNSTEQHGTAPNSVSSSLSSSLSISSSVSSSSAIDSQKTTRKRNLKPEYSPDFDEIWEVYPHPPGDEKGRAHKNYTKILASDPENTTHDTLMNAVQNYANFRQGQDKQYHKKCANFFGEDNPWQAWDKPIERNQGHPSIGISSLQEAMEEAMREEEELDF